MIGATMKQRELLNFIEAYGAEHPGRCPSFEEMKEALGLQSKSGVHRLVTALEERGLLRRLPNRARALEVIGSDFSRLVVQIPTDVLRCELERRAA